MSIKGLYDGIIHSIEQFPEKIERLKTGMAEDRAIMLKKPIYSSVQWTPEQQQQFDEYWLKVYGVKISNKWHRLYQAASGIFSVDYIPEKMYTTQIEPALNDRRYAVILEDKSLVEVLTRDCGCIVPKTLIICSNGQYYNEHREPIEKKVAIELLIGRAFVAKPSVGSSSGLGVRFVDATKVQKAEDVTLELEKQGNDFIVQEPIQAHSVFASFNNTSINTIRITTFLAENSVHHVPLAFRIGRKGKQVDNIHSGGIGVGVKDDGMLLPDAYELGYGNSTKKYKRHPDSHVLFAETELPMIPKIIQAAYKCHGRFPHIGIISWDFTVDDHSNLVLIEANIVGQGIWFPQMIHGKGPFGDYTKAVLLKAKEKRN